MIHIDLLYDTRTYACTMLNTVYLGAYNEEDAAARAYDLAALKYWGPTTYTNFPVRRILVWCGSEYKATVPFDEIYVAAAAAGL